MVPFVWVRGLTASPSILYDYITSGHNGCIVYMCNMYIYIQYTYIYILYIYL
jgi:hypothetical protein